MKYVIVIILMIISIYPFSYARYNWNKKNKLGAVGSILIGIAAIVYPTVLILTR
jgi:hypothetical protein